MATHVPLDQESLFSLELVVEKICISKLTCRFPAVAFRLLNFPALMIYHVQPDLASTIKQKIIRDVGYTPPPQLYELQDKDGNFSLKKGKSCLFKTSPNKLQQLLSTTPLYVMLIDTYPETPKLIGNCTVPLDATMDDLYDDICRMGVSMPSVHGDKGTFRLYNLMSTDIGNVTLGFRLLSLGAGLLAHIPAASISEIPTSAIEKEPTKQQESSNSMQITQDGTILQDIETHDKNLQVAISDEKPKREDACIQTRKQTVDAVGTQTKHVKVKQKVQKDQRSKEEGDVFVTNVHCPPPLFYNSEVPDKSASTMEFYSDVPDAQGIRKGHKEEPESSDDDTIRPEDKFSDSDPEELSGIKVDEINDYATLPEHRNQLKPMPQSLFMNSNVQMPVEGVPILNALMKEIMLLQGVQMQQLSHTPNVESHKAVSQKLYKALREEKKRKELSSQQYTPRDRQTRTDQVSGRKTPRECSLPQRQEVPKTKSWIRKTPMTYGVRKTNIMPGMTNTQRLRLAKANPDLLQNMEKQEEERRAKWKAKRGDSSGLISSCVSDSRSDYRHPYEENDPFANIPTLDLRMSEDSFHHKKPVPTPRHVIIKEKSMPMVTPRTTKNQSSAPVPSHDKQHTKSAAITLKSPSLEKLFLMPTDDVQYGEVTDSNQGSSARTSSRTHSSRSKIEVHLPSVGKDESVDFEPPRMGNPAKFGETQVIHDSLYQESEGNGYSEDFEDVAYTERTKDSEAVDLRSEEGIDAGEMLGLKMVVDQYSDSDSVGDDQQSLDSFHSVNSRYSGEERNQQSGLKLKIPPHVPNPASSAQSPATMSRAMTSHLDSTREPLTINSTTADETESYDAELSSPRPQPSPRRKQQRSHLQVVNTESVSSYSPSDDDLSPPLSPDSADVVASKYMKDLKIDPNAKQGYTWGY